jgi:dipeptidyl aminopeptidase/acylaminoacyl peptidase
MLRCSPLLFVLPLTAFGAVPAPERALTNPQSLAAPTIADAKPVPIADLYFTRGLSGAAWSPDGREVVVSTNFTGRYNLWKVAADGGWPIQLTQSDDRQSGLAWSPDGKWIVFESDHAGGEINDVYAVPADGGEVVNLTHSDDISETSALWSPDGKTLALSRKAKTSSIYDIALLDWMTREVRTLTHEAAADRGWSPLAWSRDGRTLYANRSNLGETEGSVWRIDVGSGRAEELTAHKGEVFIQGSAVSGDGRWLALSSNARGGSSQAALYDLEKRAYRWITNGPWEGYTANFSPDGKRLAYSINADGRSNVYLYDVAEARAEKIALPAGVNFPAGGPDAFSADGTRLLVSHQSSTEPNDYWIYPVAGGTPRQLTRSALASLKPATLPASQLVHYKSFDGTVISAFAWLPANLPRDGKAPAIVIPHGGPTGQTLDNFNRFAVALASRGYVCIAPNVRGSTGYGLTFQKANYQDLGGGDLQDEVYAAKFLVASGYIDARKIGIVGGSYGGFMALMAVGRTPDDWAAAVDWFGVTNWLSEQAHESPELQQYDQSILGNPVKDKAIYEKSSPTSYFQNIKAPLLVLQGENDIRDPKEEAEQAFKTLTASGKTVAAHYYADEGHGFVKRENQIDALTRTVLWFDRYLKGDTNAKQP